MANEFIARKGLKVLTGGVEVTGSSKFSTDVTSSGNIRANAFYGDGANVTGVISSSYAVTASYVAAGNVGGTVTSASYAMSASYATTASLATTSIVTASGAGSTITFTKGDGSTFPVSVTTATAESASYVEYNNVANKPTLVSASSQIDHDATTNFVANEHIDHSTVSITAGAGLNGGGDITTTRTLSVDSGSMLPYYSSSIFGTVSGDITITAGGVASIAANSVALGTDTTGNYASDVTAGSGIVVSGVAGEGTSFGVALDTGSATFTNGVVNALPAGTVSASSQVIASSVTGIGAYATTGSNSFTGVQSITNSTNSTTFQDGALVVTGGVGIGKDVNISGSLRVTGLLTAVSMSTQYVTSSQYTVGTSRILLNDDDNVRFAGVSVIDSGSTAGSGSLYWDSLNDRWIYENTVDATYNSAILIAGPKNEGNLGDEAGLVVGRVPVASDDDHIDSRVASSSIRVDFPTRLTHIEAGLYVTGSISSSVGFSGDGSGLTGIVTTLALTGSNDGTNQPSSVNLKTEGLVVSASEGIDVSVSGQTLTISGEDATTTNKGIASFNTNNFTVSSGAVSAKNAIVNGVNVTLGSSVNISLAEITSASATTPDQLVLNGGAIIHGVLFTSASAASLTDGANQVVASIATGSYDSAMFDYVIKDGTNFRAGTVSSVWKAGTTSIEYTDVSTNDIGDTLNQSFVVDTSAGNARLKFTTTGGGTWTVKTAIRML